MRGVLGLFGDFSLVLYKVCEAAFRGATAGSAPHLLKDLLIARGLKSGGEKLSRKLMKEERSANEETLYICNCVTF